MLFVLKSEVVEQGVYKSVVGCSIAEPVRGHCTTSPPPGLRSFDYGVLVVPLALYVEGVAMEVSCDSVAAWLPGVCLWLGYRPLPGSCLALLRDAPLFVGQNSVAAWLPCVCLWLGYRPLPGRCLALLRDAPCIVL